MQMIMVMMHRRFLTELATALVPPQIIQPWKPSLASQMMPLTYQMLMLRSVARHVSPEIAAFGIEECVADVAPRFVAVGGV
jgi:hypothetical protein